MSAPNLRIQPQTFTRDSFTFVQVFREGQIAIFEQRSRESASVVGFEVVRLRIGKPHPLDADQSPKERYPSSEEWGKFGWSYLALEEARSKALYLLDQQSKSPSN